ncbi:MAG TPA: ABC transporter permease [Gemmatimonadaceae bacterium]|nr:ABC transporter permease [Gemmatimonadaceae bacterium]
MDPIEWMMRRLRAVIARRAFERDLQDEMRDHLERSTERLIARGMSPADARLAARREFGNVAVLQEEARDARGAHWVDALAGDVRFALRYFARHKATTAIIVTVIALGTGANTLIFSMFRAQFRRPAPAMPNDDALARLWANERPSRTGKWRERGFSQPELTAFADRHEIFRDVAAWTEDDIVLNAGDSTGARALGAQFVTPNFFSVVGVRLTAGRGLRQVAGDTPDMTAVMSSKIAEQLFGSAVAAIGQRALVNEVPVYIVGVAPPRFQGAVRKMNEPALWMPLSARADIAHVSRRWLTDDAALSLFARLAPDASRDRAAAFVRHVIATAMPDSAARVGMARNAYVLAMNEPPPSDDTSGEMFGVAAIVAIGVLILLVAWTNVSSLMVAAAVGRRHEIAVRLSLGASRPRLLRQLLTESIMLAVAGSAIGLTLAWWELAYMTKTEIDGVDLMPDFPTLAFVLLMALGTGILFGLSPSLHATRTGVANALRDSGTGTSSRSRLQRAFVVAQIALSQPLLVLLGTMISLVIAEYRPLSAEMSRHVVRVDVRPLRTGAPTQRPEAVDSLVARIAGRPDVEGAVPEATAFAIRGVYARDHLPSVKSDTAPTIVQLEGSAPGWFTLLDIPILLGRDVSLADTAAADHPVVIGTDFARAHWGNANPIGRSLASASLPGWGQDSITMTVVGVYDAARRSTRGTWNGATARGDVTYRVFTARGKQWRHDRILVRTRGPAMSVMPDLQKFIRARAPALPVMSMQTLAQVDDKEYRDTLQISAFAGAGGALALLLASLGLYGVVSLAVRQRTREIGIRIAVGAEPLRVARMFLASGVRASLVALALGLPLSIAALKIGLSQGLLIAPQTNPYLIGVVIALILVAVACAATWVPARRAASVDPAGTLRVE